MQCLAPSLLIISGTQTSKAHLARNPGRAATPPKRDRGGQERKRQSGKGYKPKKARQPLLQAANERIGPGPTRQPHQPGTCMHQMTRTVSTCYSQVEEHGRLAPAGCTVTLRPPPEIQNGVAPAHVRDAGRPGKRRRVNYLLTASSRGRRVAIRPA